MLTDPVCGKRMSRVRPYIVINHNGVDYHLCCALCQAEFERAPDDHAKPELGRQAKGQRERAQKRRRGRQN